MVLPDAPQSSSSRDTDTAAGTELALTEKKRKLEPGRKGKAEHGGKGKGGGGRNDRLVFRALLNLDSRMRVQEDIQEQTFEAVDSLPEWQTILKVGKNWDAMVKREGRNHGKGSAHIWVWSAMVKVIAANSTLSQQDRAILASFIDTHKTVASLMRDVPVCIVKKVYGKAKVLVTVHVALASW